MESISPLQRRRFERDCGEFGRDACSALARRLL
jgi:hypothetical protein